MPQLIDLSHPLEHGQLNFAWDPKISVIPHNTVTSIGYNITQISLSTHQGTHLDAPFHIRVNNVDPAWIWSNETDKAANLDGGGRAKWDPIWRKYHMLRRMGHAVEVARPTLFLLSDDASFITRTKLMVNGGYLAMGPEGLGETAVIAGSD